MRSDRPPLTQLIWATRGRSWGFRFLLDGGFTDPLPEYEHAFASLEEEPATWQELGSVAALRFPDPLGRRDLAGRVIPHDFVVFDKLVEQIQSAQSGQQLVWPLVANAYLRVWDAEAPPSKEDLDFSPGAG